MRDRSGLFTIEGMRLAYFAVCVLVLASCGRRAEPIASLPEPVMAPTPFTTFRLDERISTGSQPTERDIQALAAQGYRSIINLRSAGEPGFLSGEGDLVEGLGMYYFHVPVAGAQGLSLEAAMAVAEILDQEGALPAFVHCASGNRAGAVYAIKAFHLEGRSADDALAEGRRAGLLSLEPRVSKLLAAP